FTELGRQPWAVYGLLKTSASVSPNVATGEVATTLIGFTALYGLLAVIDFGLIYRFAKLGPGEHDDEHAEAGEEPALVY
ncbi:MAG TPA: cytochrome ubiquinol oxidase subunit I, partial [Acidimicrobiales bacterium]|nr:cytochrome ubiquinol oxidase subunit I [Acidimicrobiales bacterium]